MPTSRSAGRLAPWAIAATSLAVAAWALGTRTPQVAESYEIAISAPLDSEFLLGTNSGNALISPDGTKLAFVASTELVPQVWVRPLDRDEPARLPGTENPQYPFWSPDSSRLAFFSQGALKTVDISGGLPETIAEAPNGRGGSWGANGTILFTPVGGDTVHRVAETGGEVERVTTLDPSRGENAHYWPYFLPGGERFLYFVRATTAENSGIYMARLDDPSPPVRLVAAMSSGIYAPPHGDHPGHLMWVRDGSLLAQPLDVDAARLTGAATVIASGVRVEGAQRGLLVSASDNGNLAWADAIAANHVVRWYNRQGQVIEELDIEPGAIEQLALSPDDSRLLFARPEEGTSDVWMHDFQTGNTRALVTTPGFDEAPVWSADGERVIYIGTALSLVLMDPEGGAEDRVLDLEANSFPAAVSPDGAFLVYGAPHPSGGLAPVAVSMEDFDQRTFLTEGSMPPNIHIGFSPDGSWLLLTSLRSGSSELYAARWIVEGDNVRLGEPWTQVSSGGSQALVAKWTESGEIIYIADDNYLVAVPVTQRATSLELGRRQRLFELASPFFRFMDISSDGQRFVIRTAPYAEGQTLRVLTNWHTRLPNARS